MASDLGGEQRTQCASPHMKTPAIPVKPQASASPSQSKPGRGYREQKRSAALRSGLPWLEPARPMEKFPAAARHCQITVVPAFTLLEQSECRTLPCLRLLPSSGRSPGSSSEPPPPAWNPFYLKRYMRIKASQLSGISLHLASTNNGVPS